MKKYDSYKDSRVEWIGEIPNHWLIKKIGYISKLLTGNPWKSDLFNFENGIKIVRGENVSEGFLRWGSKSRYWVEEVSDDSIFYLNDGDIIIGMDGSKVGKNYVRIKHVDLPLLLHQRMCRIRVNQDYSPNFIEYWVGSEMFRFYIDISKTDPMIPHITQKNIFDFQIPFPPLSEQTKIVSYLDEKTSLIDSLIEKTQRKIELLKEERTSLINHTVTKGLNPNVEMKDSGVEWIGEIPSHWEIKKLKYFCEMVNEKGLPEIGDVKISPENMESDTGICFNLYSEYSGEGMKFTHGDILLNKLRLYLKKILFTEYEGYSMGEMIVLRVFSGVKRFYYLTLFHQGLIDELDNQSTGVKLPRVSPEIILNTKFPYPPPSEQNQIVFFLDEKTTTIDKTIELEVKRIDYLKEYRQSIISEVVTGKIKVTSDE
jgi:type I restriction enzyme S subunit